MAAQPHSLGHSDGHISMNAWLQVKQAEMDDDANTAKQRMRLERRAAEEEDLMMRVPLTKKEMKDVKAMHRAQLTGGALLDDFADDVAGLIQVRSLSQELYTYAGSLFYHVH